MPHKSSRRGTAALAMAVSGLIFAAGCGGKSATTESTATTTNTTTSPAASTTSTSVAPNGYKLFNDSAEHFKISTPTSWRQIDPASPGAAEVMQQLLKANPNLSSLLGSGPSDLASKGIKFMAIDPSGEAFAPNVNLVVKPAVGARDSDLSQISDALKSQYQQIGGTVTSTATISLAGHQVLQVKVRLPLNTLTGGKTTVDETQDVIVANDLIYIVTFAGNSPEFSTIASTISVV